MNIILWGPNERPVKIISTVGYPTEPKKSVESLKKNTKSEKVTNGNFNSRSIISR